MPRLHLPSLLLPTIGGLFILHGMGGKIRFVSFRPCGTLFAYCKIRAIASGVFGDDICMVILRVDGLWHVDCIMRKSYRCYTRAILMCVTRMRCKFYAMWKSHNPPCLPIPKPFYYKYHISYQSLLSELKVCFIFLNTNKVSV